MADKKWRGIQMNMTVFQGEVIGDPVENGGYFFLTLRTIFTQRSEDGKYTEVDVDVPLMVEPDGPTNVAKSFIKSGRKLAAWGSYVTWDSDGTKQHAFAIKRFDLGDKPYDKDSIQK